MKAWMVSFGDWRNYADSVSRQGGLSVLLVQVEGSG